MARFELRRARAGIVQNHFLALVVPLTAKRAMKIPKIDINRKLLPMVVMTVSIPKM